MEALSKALFCHALVAGASPTAHRGQRRADLHPLIRSGWILVLQRRDDLMVLCLFLAVFPSATSVLHLWHRGHWHLRRHSGLRNEAGRRSRAHFLDMDAIGGSELPAPSSAEKQQLYRGGRNTPTDCAVEPSRGQEHRMLCATFALRLPPWQRSSPRARLLIVLEPKV